MRERTVSRNLRKRKVRLHHSLVEWHGGRLKPTPACSRGYAPHNCTPVPTRYLSTTPDRSQSTMPPPRYGCGIVQGAGRKKAVKTGKWRRDRARHARSTLAERALRAPRAPIVRRNASWRCPTSTPRSGTMHRPNDIVQEHVEKLNKINMMRHNILLDQVLPSNDGVDARDRQAGDAHDRRDRRVRRRHAARQRSINMSI